MVAFSIANRYNLGHSEFFHYLVTEKPPDPSSSAGSVNWDAGAMKFK